ncbi:MAG: 2,3-bisphosphoglycerate-independent phosphoglycerate mutase [archaeon]
MKFLMLVLDGLGDRPDKRGKTPLESAKTPNMDAFAREGMTGFLDPIKPGIVPGSDTAHLALLGFNPYDHYIGRGPYEALGSGISLKEGDLCFRTNFATIDARSQKVIDRRAGRITGNLKELEKAIKEIKMPCAFEFHHTVDHRGVVVFRGKKLSASVTPTDPHNTDVPIAKCMPTEKSKEAKDTAALVNKFSDQAKKALAGCKLNADRKKAGLPVANALLLRGPGLYKKTPTVEEVYGVRGSCVAATAIVKGVATSLGLDIINVPGATGGFDTDIKGKLDFALRSLETRDFCLINIKATDNFSHDGNAKGKTEMIEKIDSKLNMISKNVSKDLVVAILGDHTTPVELKAHSGDPVPLLICGPTTRTDISRAFDEKNCMHGGLGTIRGKHLLPILMNLAGKEKIFGA